MLRKQWLDLRCGSVGYDGGGKGEVFVYSVCGVVWYMQCVHVHLAWHVYIGICGVWGCGVRAWCLCVMCMCAGVSTIWCVCMQYGM